MAGSLLSSGEAGSSLPREAWMQVEADNAAALSVYRSLGFVEAYRYHYRRPPEE